jgi:hypothetical protein
MLADRELVALLYRADWTHLCLSGEVSGPAESMNIIMTATVRPGMEPPFQPPPPFPPETDPHRRRVMRLLLAPGKRYREDSANGQSSRGCDGERIWHWREHDPSIEMRLAGKPIPPFSTLLCPSWLLVGYDLEVQARVQACGREGIRVAATLRGGRREGEMRFFAPSVPWLPIAGFDHVDAIVDARLGILLRCERGNEGRAPILTEFRSLTVDPDVDPARFTAPPGSIIGEGYGHSFDGLGWQITKTAAGLAAAGLGAALKYSPFVRLRAPDPPEPNDADAEAAMAQDEPPPGEAQYGAQVSAEVLHLLYRSATVVPEFTARLHEWSDPRALLAAVPPSARKAGFGGVGFLIDTLDEISERDAGQQFVRHQVSNLRIGGWDRYRVDRAHGTPRGHRVHDGHDDEWVTLASDGQRRWKVYADRVSAGPSAPLPAELADLLDCSWLLGCQLSGGTEIMAGGRRAYRICVASSWSASPLMTFHLPAIAMLDAETGRLLRLTCYGDGKPLARYELRDVTDGATGDFGFEVPAGLPVVDEPSAENRPPRQPPQPTPPSPPFGDMAQAAANAVRGFFDSLLGPKPPQR